MVTLKRLFSPLVWRRLKQLGWWAIPTTLIYVLIMIGFLNFGVGKVADKILSNVTPHRDREYPVTATAIAPSSDDVLVVGGKGMGLSCSLHEAINSLVFERASYEASINLQIRQACAFHDYCYRHGAATYGYTQADCDVLLQEHAFRLCKFIARTDRQEICQRRARLIVLGVRLGGSDSFIASESTYFEFDPLPYRAEEYAVFRVAQTPLSWLRLGASQKSLYIFQMRPSGSQVAIFSLHRDGVKKGYFCNGISLPAQHGAMNVPPRVVRDVNGEEFFVWWQRRKKSETFGTLVSLSTRNAILADWREVSPGARFIQPANCYSQTELPAAPSHDPRPPMPQARRVSCDYNFSEPVFHTVPGRKGSRLSAFALRTHGCSRKHKLLCFHVFGFNSNHAEQAFDTQDATGFLAHTGIFEKEHPDGRMRKEQGNPEKDEDRYRNYVQPPFFWEVKVREA